MPLAEWSCVIVSACHRGDRSYGLWDRVQGGSFKKYLRYPIYLQFIFSNIGRLYMYVITKSLSWSDDGHWHRQLVMYVRTYINTYPDTQNIFSHKMGQKLSRHHSRLLPMNLPRIAWGLSGWTYKGAPGQCYGSKSIWQKAWRLLTQNTANHAEIVNTTCIAFEENIQFR
jgi:hypothetical protein